MSARVTSFACRFSAIAFIPLLTLQTLRQTPSVPKPMNSSSQGCVAANPRLLVSSLPDIPFYTLPVHADKIYTYSYQSLTFSLAQTNYRVKITPLYVFVEAERKQKRRH